MTNKLVIAGGTGTIGQHLVEHLLERFEDIVILSRSLGSGVGFRKVQWNGKDQGAWSTELDGAEVVINLSGKSIQTRFTEKNKKLLHDSRVDSTKAIGVAIANSKNPPPLWLNASGAAIYPPTIEQANDESVTEVGNGFKAKLSEAWEEAAYQLELPKTRQVIMRITPVLTQKDGFLPPILLISKLGLGGAQGSGKQIVSWIHYKDLCSAVQFIIDRPDVEGVVNLAAPGPLPNKEFMKVIRKAVGVPIGLPAPAFAIKIGSLFTGVEPSLILDSSHVIPGVLMAKGFQFGFPELRTALVDLI